MIICMIEILELFGEIAICIIGIIAIGWYAFACALSVGMLNIKKAHNRYLLFILCVLLTPFIFSPIAISICYKRECKLFEKEC